MYVLGLPRKEIRVCVLMILVFVALSAVNVAAQTALQKVSISMSSTGMPSIQLYIAREKNCFREEGFEPQLIRMSANAAIAAGVAGELDALGSVGSAVRAIMRGVPLRVIAVENLRLQFAESRKSGVGDKRVNDKCLGKGRDANYGNTVSRG